MHKFEITYIDYDGSESTIDLYAEDGAGARLGAFEYSAFLGTTRLPLGTEIMRVRQVRSHRPFAAFAGSDLSEYSERDATSARFVGSMMEAMREQDETARPRGEASHRRKGDTQAWEHTP